MTGVQTCALPILVSALVCVAAVLCGACAFRAPAPVAVAQAQGRHTDCEFADELSDCRGRSRSRGSDISTAAARDPPKLDMAQTCEAATQSSIGRGKQACLDQERTAQEQLTQNWSQHSAANKIQCADLTIRGGPPSYVELISCLELMEGAQATRNADGSASDVTGSVYNIQRGGR